MYTDSSALSGYQYHSHIFIETGINLIILFDTTHIKDGFLFLNKSGDTLLYEEVKNKVKIRNQNVNSTGFVVVIVTIILTNNNSNNHNYY